MHPVIKFYQVLAQYLECRDPVNAMVLDQRLVDIYKRCRKGEFRLLNQNEWRSSRRFLEAGYRVRTSLLLIAFQDLSQIKNLYAMDAFRSLQRTAFREDGLYLFTSNEHIREGGQSSVMTLHVSDRPRFIDCLWKLGDLCDSGKGFSLRPM